MTTATTNQHHVLSVLVENKAGVLSRVTNLFARRGYNIFSLAVAPTDAAIVSLQAPEAIYLDDKVSVKVDLKFDGLKGSNVVVRLLEAEKPVEERKVAVADAAHGGHLVPGQGVDQAGLSGPRFADDDDGAPGGQLGQLGHSGARQRRQREHLQQRIGGQRLAAGLVRVEQVGLGQHHKGTGPGVPGHGRGPLHPATS